MKKFFFSEKVSISSQYLGFADDIVMTWPVFWCAVGLLIDASWNCNSLDVVVVGIFLNLPWKPVLNCKTLSNNHKNGLHELAV